MALAEIHGKAPFAYSEDLLTADVFTAFRYLPTPEGIGAFLAPILGLDQEQSTNGRRMTCAFHFWPLGLRRRREPDVLLAWQIGDRLIHVVIEAKYMSGSSDLEMQEMEDEIGQTQKIGNQLGDQLHDLQYGQYRIFQDGQRNQYLNLTSLPEDRHLLYLTAHLLRPEAEMEQALDAYSAAEGRLHWANWYQVCEHFQKMRLQFAAMPESLILTDIYQLLDRKGFASFHGFRQLPAGRLHPASASFWLDKYLDEIAFSGIRPPTFSTLPAAANFWRN
jgi:hypothetical protein